MKFDPYLPIAVTFEGEPALDAGGPRREFYHGLFQEMAFQSCLFEGPPDRLRPRYTPQIVMSGLFKMLGRALAQAIILEGMGFPYLSPIFYEYIVYGQPSMVIAGDHITNEDMDLEVQHVLNLVSEN